jgi:hypothetical protein
VRDHTAPVPDAVAFAALARSSPWRWSTLRFTVRFDREHEDPAGIRAWLRRPDVVRVETVGGALLQIVRERPQDGERTEVLFRPDGLVADRRDWFSYDAPMYQNYFWVAMLDPLELADGRDPESGEPSWPAVLVDAVTEVEHAGRRAWEAVVRPTDVYEPRCGCCPLLRTHDVDVREWGDDVRGVLAEYPEAYRVRLDVGTGVCVLTEAIGGLTPGAGHDLHIEAVDEPMDDALFARPRRRMFGPRP